MPRFDGFMGGSETAYSTKVGIERTVNLYPEIIESQLRKTGTSFYDPNRVVLYGTPGLSLLVSIVVALQNVAGINYTAGDVLTVVGGTGTAATIKVDTIGAGGAIATWHLVTSGAYTIKPANPVAVTGGTGTTAKFDLHFATSIKQEFYDTATDRIFGAACCPTSQTTYLVEIFKDGTQWNRGALTTGVTLIDTAVSISSNGTQLLIVDPNGYGATGTGTANLFVLATNVLTNITASVAAANPRWGQFLDGYFIALGNNGKIYLSALNDGSTWNAADVATPESSPDRARMILADRENLWIWGDDSIEIWFNSGNADFPFQPNKPATIQSGLIYWWSVAASGNSVFWVSRERNGRAIVMQVSGGFNPQRISTHAVEFDLQESTQEYWIGWTYQEQGHNFYVLTDLNLKTWVYDSTTQIWHERMYLNGTTEEAHRGRCAILAGEFGTSTAAGFSSLILVGDRGNGNIYKMRLPFLDDAGATIRRYRRAQHLSNENKFNYYHRFEIVGEFGIADFQRIDLRWSDDGGKTFTDWDEVDVGANVNRSAVVRATVSAGGSGYTVGDVLTVVGGTGTVVATLKVLQIVHVGMVFGIINGDLAIVSRGSYIQLPANPVAVAGGTGAGATITLYTDSPFVGRAFWQRLGRSRDRVFEIKLEDPVRWVLTEALLESLPGEH